MQPTKVKLALMSSQLSWGGGEQFLWSLGNGMLERGHSVLWICDQSSPLHERIQQKGLDCCSLPGRTPKPRDLLALRRMCTKQGTQLLHANDSHALTWGSLAMMGKLAVKRVGVKHTAFPIRSSVRYNWMLDALVCVSNAVKEVCMDSGISTKKLHVIHGGVQPPNLNRGLERLWACETLGIQHDTPLFCAVGSLIPCKAYDRLIEAAYHLRWHMPDFCIVLCGEGKSRPDLEKQIRKYSLQKHVRLLGFQSEPERWICAADAFVHPTQNEGLSLVTIQSQMIGTPVIATEVGGLKEVLRTPHETQPLGWILQGSDPANLAETMIRSLQNTNERHQMISAAKKSALERFHLDRMIDKFEQFYLAMVDPLRNLSSPVEDSVKAYRLAS
jgi:glycosyltransferase involved in cell wall biosynthesis